MKLIRDFDLAELMAIAASSELPLVLRDGSLEVTGTDPVDMILPSVNPKLVWRFRAFQVLNEVPDTIYLAGMTANGKYQHFSAGAWVVSDDPVFQAPDDFRAGLEEWIGPFQVTLRMMPLARLWKVLLGYEVTLDLLDFIVRNSLPQYLEIPVQYSLPAVFTNGKGTVALPPMDYFLSPAGIGKMEFSQLASGTRSRVTAVVSVEGGHQVTLRNRVSGSGYLHLEFTPKVNYADEGTFYQIEELPSVVIRRKESSEIGYPYFPEVAQGVTEDFTCYSLNQLDLLMEVIVVAPSEGMGQAIANKILSKIREDAKLEVSAFGMSFPVVAMSGVKSDRNTQAIKGSTPKISFQIAVRNIILMTS